MKDVYVDLCPPENCPCACFCVLSWDLLRQPGTTVCAPGQYVDLSEYNAKLQI